MALLISALARAQTWLTLRAASGSLAIPLPLRNSERRSGATTGVVPVARFLSVITGSVAVEAPGPARRGRFIQARTKATTAKGIRNRNIPFRNERPSNKPATTNKISETDIFHLLKTERTVQHDHGNASINEVADPCRPEGRQRTVLTHFQTDSFKDIIAKNNQEANPELLGKPPGTAIAVTKCCTDEQNN